MQTPAIKNSGVCILLALLLLNDISWKPQLHYEIPLVQKKICSLKTSAICQYLLIKLTIVFKNNKELPEIIF